MAILLHVTVICAASFLAVPFLLELRALMDWMWTDTTLGISSWLQMEDIYANIFVLKCVRWAEKVVTTDVLYINIHLVDPVMVRGKRLIGGKAANECDGRCIG